MSWTFFLRGMCPPDIPLTLKKKKFYRREGRRAERSNEISARFSNPSCFMIATCGRDFPVQTSQHFEMKPAEVEAPRLCDEGAEFISVPENTFLSQDPKHPCLFFSPRPLLKFSSLGTERQAQGIHKI